MANIYEGTLELIGHTPLVEFKHIEKKFGLEARLLAKLEYFNPAGSVKDRIAKEMIGQKEDIYNHKEDICKRIKIRFFLSFALKSWIYKEKKEEK